MSDTIVILHGWGRGSKSFISLKNLLEGRGYSAIFFDLPGFGAAGPPPKPWSVSDYANFVLERIESQNLGKVCLFGHSFGGRIAIKFAANYPERLAGLILCDAAGVTPRPKLKIAAFSYLSKIGNWIFSSSFLKLLRESARRFFYFLLGGRDYYFLQNDVMRETFRKVIDENLAGYLPKIKTPTMIIWGKNDKITPLSDAYFINKNIAGSELKILDGVGHSPYAEAPNELAKLIDHFISKTPSK